MKQVLTSVAGMLCGALISSISISHARVPLVTAIPFDGTVVAHDTATHSMRILVDGRGLADVYYDRATAWYSVSFILRDGIISGQRFDSGGPARAGERITVINRSLQSDRITAAAFIRSSRVLSEI